MNGKHWKKIHITSISVIWLKDRFYWSLGVNNPLYAIWALFLSQTFNSNTLLTLSDWLSLFLGGKDSTVLAYVMKLLNERYNYGLNLVLLSVDEGITGYRDDSLETVKRNKVKKFTHNIVGPVNFFMSKYTGAFQPGNCDGFQASSYYDFTSSLSWCFNPKKSLPNCKFRFYVAPSWSGRFGNLWKFSL